ncbi:hypothetical protein F4779DRAFT_200492 [Xylariaceae sp. FL0662B]|nr:hypothetical protein F4779DRAFT_200492 [Xylariaceae sp. FL0662B]
MADAAGTTTRGEQEVLYFAYGSNLSTTQMHQRCPQSVPVGLAHLAGWNWIINERGYANIVQDAPSTAEQQGTGTSAPDNGVYGLLYRLHPDDEAALDAVEGVPWAYEKRFLDVDLVGGDGDSEVGTGKETPGEEQGEEGGKGGKKKLVRQALAYVDFRRVEPGAPKDEYVVRMNRGIREAVEKWQFPEAYVEKVMRPFLPAE